MTAKTAVVVFMRSKQFATILGLLIAVTMAIPARNAQSAAPLQAAAVLGDIKSRGARAVVDSLWAVDGRWDTVMTNVAGGKAEWLEVAAALHPGTDAGASETLDEAIFLALKPAPVAVLWLLKDGVFDTNFVCSSNIGTDYSQKESRRFVRDRIKVLAAVTELDVAGARDRCLQGLRGALKILADSK
jgi:hypothetical protein